MPNESYRLTFYGLLSMEVGEDAAKRAVDRLELYLCRHYGTPSGVILTADGSFTFASLKEESNEECI